MKMIQTITTTALLLLLFISKVCFGQSIESDSINNVRIKIICVSPISSNNSPLYIITVNNKRLQIPEGTNFKDSTEIVKTLDYINPNWIKSIKVLREKDATDQYGTPGQNGVVLIDLKKGSLKNFPPKFRKYFKDN